MDASRYLPGAEGLFLGRFLSGKVGCTSVDRVVGRVYERSSNELKHGETVDDREDILVESEGISGDVEYNILIRLIGCCGGKEGKLGRLVPTAEFFTNFNLMTV